MILLHLGVLAGLSAISVLTWSGVWFGGHPATTITCQCGDPSQALWFIDWTPWALVHGHNPLLSNAIYTGQGGANMLVNTAWALPSLVLAPITWAFGPIASFNVAVTLAPAVSGWCVFLAARRVSTFVPGQVLAAVLYGFSPFIVWNEPYGHLNFTLLFFPPLAFVLLHDLLVTRAHRPARVGLLLGLLVIAQFFTGTEFLAMCVVVGAVALVGTALMAPRQAWENRRAILTGLGVGAGVTAVVLAYPVWFVLRGPRHIVGGPWPGTPGLGVPPSAVVSPGHATHATAFANMVGGYYGGLGPNFSSLRVPTLDYLGIPLLVLLAISAFNWSRSRTAWSLVIAGVIAWLFSFGTTLGTQYDPIAQQVHPWWLPWRLLARLPLVSEIFSLRFGALVAFAAAMLLAVSLDGWWRPAQRLLSHTGRRRAHTPTTRWRLGAPVVITAVAAATLAPIAAVTAVPYAIRSSAPPAWFSQDAPRLPAGTVVLAVPFVGQAAMGWQAQTNLHFDLAGGFAVVPGPSGRSEFVDPPTGAPGILGQLSPSSLELRPALPPATPKEVDTIRRTLERWRVGVVVVTRVGQEPEYSAGFLTATLGRAPRYQDGAWVWYGLGRSSPATLPRDALTDCERQGAHGAPMAVPDCVMRAAGSGGA